MARPEKKLSYISVPSQIITSLSSSSLQSLLLSPSKSSSKPFSSFFSFPSLSYKSPRLWFLALFLVALLGMLNLVFDLDPLTPFSPYPCLTSDGFSRSHLGMATTVRDPNARTDQILKTIEEQRPSISRKSNEDSEFCKQPDGMGSDPKVYEGGRHRSS